MEQDLKDLLSSLLSSNPCKRLSAIDILEHSWMKGEENETIRVE